MPLDAARWQIDILAADKTATAFASATGRMQAFARNVAPAGKQVSDSLGATSIASRAAGAGIGLLTSALGPLAIGYAAAAQAQRVWDAGMKAANLGEQAEQVGLTTDALQAYRFQAAQNGVEVEKLDGAMMRLTAAMGQAAKGGEDQIKLFERIGVKILDAEGNLRKAGDLAPEVAQGLLRIGSESQRNALLVELLGKSGMRMVTMLKDWAGGNDALIASVRQQGGILESDVIDKWDKVGDAMERAKLTADVTFAKLGAPIATAGLTHFNNVVAATKDGIEKLGKAWDYVSNLFTNNSTMDLSLRQDTLRAQLENLKDSTDALDVAKVAQIRRDLAAISDTLASRAKVVTLPAVTVTGDKGGVSNPSPKGSGTDAYAKIIADANQYIAAKKAETDAIGMNAEAAARLKHETDLLGKATSANLVLGPQQVTQLKGLAQAMAEADAAFKSSKFMDDAATKSQEFVAAQTAERDALFMSTEAAMAYRIEQELLNKAANDNIVLTDLQKSTLGEYAAAQASAAEKTRQTKEWLDLGKDSVRGFVSDIQQGKTVLEAFGNVLNKVADKLLQMAIDDVFSAAFDGGKGGGSGGNFGGIVGWISSLFGPSGSGTQWAKGGAFSGGNVIPFRRGGIVNRPTLFPMANGMGLMGEAGPEAVVPLRRGRGGRLGIEASGAGGGTVVNVYNYADGTKATTKESKGPGGQLQVDVIVESVEAKIAGRFTRGQGPLRQAVQSTFGLQEQGRG